MQRKIEKSELVTRNNGVRMPALGFGVFQTPPDVTAAAVAEALRCGYRHVDTAAAYFNEREVGNAIRLSGIARDNVFIETKIWISDYGYDARLHAFDKAAGKLGVDALDLLILHQPLPSAFDRTLNAYRGAREAARGQQGARHWREQLHAQPPRTAVERDFRGAGREPDRVPPIFPADCAAVSACRAWHPDPGMVAHRRHHVLQGRQQEHLPRSDAAGPRAAATRQIGRT